MATVLDEDLIARVYPCRQTPKVLKASLDVIRSLHNRRLFRSAQDAWPYLELRFGENARSGEFLFGTDGSCDVVMNIPGSKVSTRHFAVAFDEHHRPIIQDLQSAAGCTVTYNGEGEEARRDFTWLIGGHSRLKPHPKIIVTAGRLRFEIVVASHDITSAHYVQKVHEFRNRSPPISQSFGNLGLQGLWKTELPTGAEELAVGPVYLTDEVGEGGYGVVERRWDVSSGEDLAIKRPSRKAVEEKRFRLSDWVKEARILNDIDHCHIMKLLAFDPGQIPDKLPALHFNYIPGGSLEGSHKLSIEECQQILVQGLSALRYLHSRDPPVIHRDIKPDNTLVEWRKDGKISIRLGDFGLAGDHDDPATRCGTPLYQAPELYPPVKAGKWSPYTATVDVWSLGVTILRCAYGLPAVLSRDGFRRCKELVDHCQKTHQARRDNLSRVLVNKMLVVNADDRASAQECYDYAQRLFDAPNQAGPQAIVPASPGFETPKNPDSANSGSANSTGSDKTVRQRSPSVISESQYTAGVNRPAPISGPLGPHGQKRRRGSYSPLSSSSENTARPPPSKRPALDTTGSDLIIPRFLFDTSAATDTELSRQSVSQRSDDQTPSWSSVNLPALPSTTNSPPTTPTLPTTHQSSPPHSSSVPDTKVPAASADHTTQETLESSTTPSGPSTQHQPQGPRRCQIASSHQGRGWLGLVGSGLLGG